MYTKTLQDLVKVKLHRKPNVGSSVVSSVFHRKPNVGSSVVSSISPLFFNRNSIMAPKNIRIDVYTDHVHTAIGTTWRRHSCTVRKSDATIMVSNNSSILGV